MSARSFAGIAKRLREAASDAAWVQWHALGGQVAARLPTSIVDPEALLLVSLALGDTEPRFRDMLVGFMKADTRRISVQRLRRVASLFPPRVASALGHFASGVSAAGDARWKRLAAGRTLEGRAGKVGSAAVRLTQAGSLMLRLRAAFGVDVRADVLSFFLGSQGVPASIPDMRTDLGYATNSLRSACESLHEAGLVTVHATRPARYGLRWSHWQRFLDIEIWPWHRWSSIYATTVALQDWLAEHASKTVSPTIDRMLTAEWIGKHGALLAALEVDLDRAQSLSDLADFLTHHLESWS